MPPSCMPSIGMQCGMHVGTILLAMCSLPSLSLSLFLSLSVFDRKQWQKNPRIRESDLSTACTLNSSTYESVLQTQKGYICTSFCQHFLFHSMWSMGRV
jgi:hypothetical protein